MATDAIFHKIDEDRFNCESLVKLAEITDFRFFISTTLDDRLVKAICNARKLKKEQVREINYSMQELSYIPQKEEDEPPVTVFNLFGCFGDILKPAFNEEEMLEHIFTLSKNDKDHTMANYFMECMKKKNIAFYWLRFPGLVHAVYYPHGHQ
jgi:hypothetical protein